MKKALKVSLWIIIPLVTLPFLILLVSQLRFVLWLKFYDIPEYQFVEDGSWHEDEEPEGYERRQFAICTFRWWCQYKPVGEGFFVIYRNNNNYSDQRFGTVKEIREKTYILEVINENKEKNLIEIPKKWVFGKD